MDMAINEQIKKNRIRWVDALKSGKYKKGVDYLRGKDDCYCCLGVACDLFVESKPVFDGGVCYRYNGEGSTAPNQVVQALGLYDRWGRGRNDKDLLTSINDDNDSFAPVIKAIESGEHWKPLT